MPKNVMNIVVLILVLGLAGCASSNNAGGGITMRSYMQDQERVDQEITGNAGYLMGTPKVDNTERKKTRKVFVMEFTKNPPELPEPERVRVESSLPPYEPPPSRQSEDAGIVLPDMSSQAEPVGETSFEEYTIEKNDTLQKISKKFYNSYAKWPKIYEVNKDVIGDPNNVKPGTVIKIPHLN